MELKTKTKMFCDSLNDPNEKHSNINICPVCTGQPGTLPVINKLAVESILKVGMALNGEIPQYSKFDRKNYFYPDLPKGYQISQYDLPLIFGGVLNGVRLRRIHLEEDTGRLVHGFAEQRGLNADHAEKNQRSPFKSAKSAKSAESASFVDFNRAGVPLMELVTEPDIKNAEQAVEFAKELQLILRYLGISDADMEKGQMRVEANISLREIEDKRGLNADHADKSRRSSLKSAESSLGTKVEVKNINSFKAVHDAIEYELKRQEEVLKSSNKITHETRGWNDERQATVSQRVKEEAHDYRYLPEPDLPPLDLSKFDLGKIKMEIPELPQTKRARFAKEYALTPEQAEILISDRNEAKYFEESVSELKSELPAADCQLLYNYFTSDLRGLMMKVAMAIADIKISPEDFADLIVLVSNKEISSRTAKDLLSKMFETGVDPRQFLQSENLAQISDEQELQNIASKIIDQNPKPAEDYKKGKENALQFLVGKAMAELKGKGNPEILQKVFKNLLKP